MVSKARGIGRRQI